MGHRSWGGNSYPEHRRIIPWTPGECPRAKRTYPTRADARAAAKRINNQPGNGKVYDYRCPVCPGFHVGHRDPLFVHPGG